GRGVEEPPVLGRFSDGDRGDRRCGGGSQRRRGRRGRRRGGGRGNGGRRGGGAGAQRDRDEEDPRRNSVHFTALLVAAGSNLVFGRYRFRPVWSACDRSDPRNGLASRARSARVGARERSRRSPPGLAEPNAV